MHRNVKSWAVLAAFAVLVWPALAADGLLKPTNVVDTWRLEQHEQAKAAASVDGDALLIDVTNVDGEAWHVQLFQFNLDLKGGQQYVLTFKAKASEGRDMQAIAGIDQEDWHNIGLDETVQLDANWKDFTFTFTVNEPAANKNRIGFAMGQSKGKIWLKDVTLKAK